MNKNNRKGKTFTMAFTAILSALIILMTLTGIGYIPIGPFKLTLNTLPVAVGATLCGPTAGFILGLVFGLTSFATGLFGVDALATLIIGFGFKQTVLLFVACVVPRILCGLVPGFISEILRRRGANSVIACGFCCSLTALLNTIFFLGAFWVFFANDFVHSEELVNLFGGQVVNSFGKLFVIFAGWNAIIEILTNALVGTPIVKVLSKQKV